MKIGTWLLTLVQPFLAKILLSLGFSVVSIVGMDSVLGSLKTGAINGMNSLPPDMLAFALYIWIGKGLGIIFAACATKLMLWTIQNGTKILGVNPS